MTERDSLVTTLDVLVPEFKDDPQEWEDVLHRAGASGAGRRRGGRRRRLAVAALAALAVCCGVVLSDPFADDENGVLDLALAAVGDGPVLHLVTRPAADGTLVDLASGDRRRIRVEREAWFDPARGYRTTLRVEGTVVEEYGASADQPVRLRVADRWMQVFTRDYRAALESGRARVLREGSVGGMPVYWIRVEMDRPGPAASPCARGLCHVVAISRETYLPVFVRFGPPRVGYGERILELESLPAGAGRLPRKATAPTLAAFQPLSRRPVNRSMARRLLGTRLAWPGREVGGLTLAEVEAGGEREYRSDRPRPRPRPRLGPPNRVITLIYGEPGEIASGRRPRSWDRVLVVNEARGVTYSLLRAPRPAPVRPSSPAGYVPPRGSAVLTDRGRRAILRRQGLVIGVIGSDPRLVRAALVALRGRL